MFGTYEIVAEPDYDGIKIAAILNFYTNLLYFIISIIVGRFQISFKMYKMTRAVYSQLTKMAAELMMTSPKWLTS